MWLSGSHAVYGQSAFESREKGQDLVQGWNLETNYAEVDLLLDNHMSDKYSQQVLNCKCLIQQHISKSTYKVFVAMRVLYPLFLVHCKRIRS